MHRNWTLKSPRSCSLQRSGDVHCRGRRLILFMVLHGLGSHELCTVQAWRVFVCPWRCSTCRRRAIEDRFAYDLRMIYVLLITTRETCQFLGLRRCIRGQSFIQSMGATGLDLIIEMIVCNGLWCWGLSAGNTTIGLRNARQGSFGQNVNKLQWFTSTSF